MTQNTLELWPEILGVLGGALILFLFAVTIAIHHRANVVPGSRGHRDTSMESGHEEIRPDGYIDSFAGEIEEAGGGMPPVIKLALPAVLIWWLLYILLFWAPR